MVRPCPVETQDPLTPPLAAGAGRSVCCFRGITIPKWPVKTPRLKEGRVYRTEKFRDLDSNPTRLVNRLVRLTPLSKGLYYAPRESSFGPVPPREDEVLRAFFRGKPYLRTGPSTWNALGLGATMVEVWPLVYNTTRSGRVELAGKPFELRRVRFPRQPTPEFFVVDLIENRGRAGLDVTVARHALVQALKAGRFSREGMEDMAGRFGTQATRDFVQSALAEAV